MSWVTYLNLRRNNLFAVAAILLYFGVLFFIVIYSRALIYAA